MLGKQRERSRFSIWIPFLWHLLRNLKYILRMQLTIKKIFKIYNKAQCFLVKRLCFDTLGSLGANYLALVYTQSTNEKIRVFRDRQQQIRRAHSLPAVQLDVVRDTTSTAPEINLPHCHVCNHLISAIYNTLGLLISHKNT